jgi:sulfotransferase family protein
MMNPIIVVGPGRCGTSCVAGILHHLGVFMGERLLSAHPTNPYGHFEDRDFLDLNIGRLEKGLSKEEWEIGVRELIERRRVFGTPWGWKDPRTCNLLRDYLRLLDAPKFVRCRRDPDQIEDSVVKAYGANGWTVEAARALRVRRERELDRYLPWYETMEVNFESMREHREATVRALAKFCGLTNVKEERIRAAIEFIRPPAPVDCTEPRPAKVNMPRTIAQGTRPFRGWVGNAALYDVIGAAQFNVLTLLGMREQHSLLDVGCGSLRAGRLAIPYLLPGHYFGIEPEAWLIEDGIEQNLGPETAKLKQPHFSTDANFTCSIFGRKFDFILAHSIFSHAAPHQVRRCLVQAAEAMHDRSLLVATYNEGRTNYGGTEWVYPGSVCYRRDWFHALAARSGLVTRPLNWYHPTSQSWVVLAPNSGIRNLDFALSRFHVRCGLVAPDVLNQKRPPAARDSIVPQSGTA